MPRKRTGNILWETDHYVARVSASSRPDDGRRVRVHLPKEYTKEQAQAEANRLSQCPDEVAKVDKEQRRAKHSKAVARANRRRADAKKKGFIKPKLHGKEGRMLRTEKGRKVFHQHVVASLITKTATAVVSKKMRVDIYERKSCDGTDPIVRVCDVMNASMVTKVPTYIESECEP